MPNPRIYNWKPSPADERDLPSTRHLYLPPTSLPSEFELEKKIPIYDQEDLGSCTANSGCVCYRLESAQLLGDFRFEPSRLFLYYNTRLLEGTPEEDSGAYIRDVFKALNKYGLAHETFFPYNTRDFAKKPTADALINGLKNVVVKYTAVQQNQTVIKQTLLSGAAISFGFNVYTSFEHGNWHTTSGMMPIPKNTELLLGGHAVTIIGWSDSKQAFLIQNSWGTEWGLEGKFWMPYSFLLSKQCDDFWCIDEIKILEDVPQPVPVNKFLEVAKVMFKTHKELHALKETSLVRLGEQIGADVNISYSFAKNCDNVSKLLGL